MTAIHRRVELLRAGADPSCISRTASGWAVMGISQLLPGYCLLLPDPVVTSLNDLTDAQRAAFLFDMTRLGDAVIRVCAPRRLNYEMLGNVEPALHAHVIPRYHSEPAAYAQKAVWLYPQDVWDAPSAAFHAERHAQLLQAIRTALGERGAASGWQAGAMPPAGG